MVGGKGGETETTVKLPKELKDAAVRNLSRSEAVGQVGYMPYSGPSVAAMTPRQIAAMRNTNKAASAYGLDTTGPNAGMPATTTMGGITGYSSFPLYQMAVSAIPKHQREALSKFFLGASDKKGKGANKPITALGPDLAKRRAVQTFVGK